MSTDQRESEQTNFNFGAAWNAPKAQGKIMVGDVSGFGKTS